MRRWHEDQAVTRREWLLHRRGRVLYNRGRSQGDGPGQRPPGSDPREVDCPCDDQSGRIRKRHGRGCPGRPVPGGGPRSSRRYPFADFLQFARVEPEQNAKPGSRQASALPPVIDSVALADLEPERRERLEALIRRCSEPESAPAAKRIEEWSIRNSRHFRLTFSAVRPIIIMTPEGPGDPNLFFLEDNS